MTTIETPSVIRNLWKSVLALGVLTLVLGAAVLIWPGDSIVVASVVFGVYLLVSGIAQAIAAFTVGVSPGSRVWLFISGAVSVALGYFAFRDFKQRRRRVDAGHMDRRWIHIPRCHGDRIGDRCSSTARAGLVRVRRDPDCDRRRLLRGRPVHRRVPALPCRAAQPPGRRDRLSCSCHVDRCFGARILT